MKTAISLDDNLLHEADETARQMGLSRSRLFALALEGFLAHRRQAKMLERLNEVYANESGAEEKRMAAKMKVKFRATIKDRW